jgi:phage shock protein C
MPDKKHLYRSKNNKMIAGICGGIAEYINTDPTIVRIILVLLAFTGLPLIVYPILWIIIPLKT